MGACRWVAVAVGAVPKDRSVSASAGFSLAAPAIESWYPGDRPYRATAAVLFAQVRFPCRPELPEVHHSASVAIPHRGMMAFICLSGAGKTGSPR
jgi:hypothetical protein